MNPKVIILLTLCFMSCTKTDQTKTLIITSFPKEIELKGTVFYTSCRLLNPTRLCIWDDKLILYDHTNDFLFKAFRLPGLEYLNSYGTIGNGPNEFREIDENYMIPAGKYLELADRGRLKRLTFETNKLTIVKEIVLPVLESPLNRLQRLNDTLYMIDNLPTDASCEHNLISLNSNRIIKKFGQYPEDGLVFKNNVEKFQAYRKYNVSKPGGEKLAVFYNYFNKFKIYDASGELLRTITLNDITCNVYDTGRPEENPVYFFPYPYATNEFIYVIRFNLTETQVMQNLENIKTEVLVFDWQGNPVADCKLDRSITAFTVSSDNKKLYAVLITRENEIYEFDLSGLLLPNEN